MFSMIEYPAITQIPVLRAGLPEGLLGEYPYE